MAKCGVKKYDALPSRVGWVDVDAIRASYFDVLKRKKYLEEKLEQVIKKEAGKNGV